MDGKTRFLAPLLATLLLTAGTAYAAAPAPSPAPSGQETASVAPEEEFEVIEEVEEEDPAAECAEAHAEFAHGEIELEELEEFCEGVKGTGGSPAAGDCPLRSAHAHATVHHETLKVTLGYTAYEPFQASLQLSPHLGTLKRHLSRTGTVRITHQLGQGLPDRVVLRMRPLGSAGCPSRRLVLFSG